jgi:hypothetical protein
VHRRAEQKLLKRVQAYHKRESREQSAQLSLQDLKAVISVGGFAASLAESLRLSVVANSSFEATPRFACQDGLNFN